MSRQMEIKLSVDLSNTDGVLALTQFLQNFAKPETQEDETSQKETPKKAAPKKAAPKKAAPKKKETAKQEPEEQDEQDEENENIRIEDVRAALAKKVGKHRDEIKAKLTEFGANNVTSLEPAKYVDFMDFLNSL